MAVGGPWESGLGWGPLTNTQPNVLIDPMPSYFRTSVRQQGAARRDRQSAALKELEKRVGGVDEERGDHSTLTRRRQRCKVTARVASMSVSFSEIQQWQIRMLSSKWQSAKTSIKLLIEETVEWGKGACDVVCVGMTELVLQRVSVHTVSGVSDPTAGPGHWEKHKVEGRGGTSSGSEGSAHLQIQAKASDAKPVCQGPLSLWFWP
ncbi:hypothetical protein PAMP_008232 [Pampus punctatissimus]